MLFHFGVSILAYCTAVEVSSRSLSTGSCQLTPKIALGLRSRPCYVVLTKEEMLFFLREKKRSTAAVLTSTLKEGGKVEPLDIRLGVAAATTNSHGGGRPIMLVAPPLGGALHASTPFAPGLH